MPTSPSIVPHGGDLDTYLVLDDFGRSGRAWRETDEGSTDRETLIRDLVDRVSKELVVSFSALLLFAIALVVFQNAVERALFALETIFAN